MLQTLFKYRVYFETEAMARLPCKFIVYAFNILQLGNVFL